MSVEAFLQGIKANQAGDQSFYRSYEFTEDLPYRKRRKEVEARILEAQAKQLEVAVQERKLRKEQAKLELVNTGIRSAITQATAPTQIKQQVKALEADAAKAELAEKMAEEGVQRIRAERELRKQAERDFAEAIKLAESGQLLPSQVVELETQLRSRYGALAESEVSAPWMQKKMVEWETAAAPVKAQWAFKVAQSASRIDAALGEVLTTIDPDEAAHKLQAVLQSPELQDVYMSGPAKDAVKEKLDRALDYVQKAASRKQELVVEKQEEARRLTPPGYRLLPNSPLGPQEAQNVRKNLYEHEKLIRSISGLLALAESVPDLGDIKSLGDVVDYYKQSKAVQTEINTLVGALRIPLTGPGVMTDSEREFIKKNIGDPTALVWRDLEIARLRAIASTIVNAYERELYLYGLEPKDEHLQTLGLRRSNSGLVVAGPTSEVANAVGTGYDNSDQKPSQTSSTPKSPVDVARETIQSLF